LDYAISQNKNVRYLESTPFGNTSTIRNKP